MPLSNSHPRPARGPRRLCTLALCCTLSATLAGCSTAGEGALSGAGIGALSGLAIGSVTGGAGTGAAIGAVAGAVGGAVIGDQNERRSQGR